MPEPCRPPGHQVWGPRYRRTRHRPGSWADNVRTTAGRAAITVADLGEFGLIAKIQALAPPGPAQLVGIGDDAAVLRAPDGRVVATMDLLVEDRHFRRGWSTAFDIGCKAAAQNLADVAAMGASPTALLVGLAAPGDLPVAWAEDLTRGLVAECSRGGAFLAGGDVSSAEKITLAITALGDLAGREPVTRAGARPGDQLALAGRTGHSAAGLALLEAGLTEPAALIASHRRPRPPYPAGPQAAALGATSMIDISDGLLADLGHVARASGVTIDIQTERLEDSRLAAAAAALGGADWLRWVLTGGEDHALAATFPAGLDSARDPDPPPGRGPGQSRGQSRGQGGIRAPPRGQARGSGRGPGRSPGRGWRVIGTVSAGGEAGGGVRVDGRAYPGPPGWRHFA